MKRGGCNWWRRPWCVAPMHEAPLGWQCAVCGLSSPPNLNKRKVVAVEPPGGMTSLSGVFIALDNRETKTQASVTMSMTEARWHTQLTMAVKDGEINEEWLAAAARIVNEECP